MSGATLALLSALLFGISTPLAKLLLEHVTPWMLAGLLYLGSGVGLAAIGWPRWSQWGAAREAMPKRRDWLWLGGAVLSGGIAAPVLLMFGLSRISASSASLLLNLESVLTALLAWFVFREQFDRRIAAGMAAIAAGAVLLSWSGEWSPQGAVGPAAVMFACLAWAIDNNLTRKVALTDPVLIAAVKGGTAGIVNLGIAAAIGSGWPGIATMGLAAMLGFAGYGISLVLFVRALRSVGAARTGAYFSTAPFVGAAIGMLFLGDPLTMRFLAAAALMALGVWLHLTEVHEHEHEHLALEHEHSHVHDEHHRHDHRGHRPDVPHSHIHRHARLRHKHPHFPDEHHLHDHPRSR